MQWGGGRGGPLSMTRHDKAGAGGVMWCMTSCLGEKLKNKRKMRENKGKRSVKPSSVYTVKSYCKSTDIM